MHVDFKITWRTVAMSLGLIALLAGGVLIGLTLSGGDDTVDPEEIPRTELPTRLEFIAKVKTDPASIRQVRAIPKAAYDDTCHGVLWLDSVKGEINAIGQSEDLLNWVVEQTDGRYFCIGFTPQMTPVVSQFLKRNGVVTQTVAGD